MPYGQEFVMFQSINRTRAVVVSSLLALPVMAFAQADPFTTAVTDATTKVGTYGAALVGLAAVGVVFGIAIKYVKRIRGAA
jgi:hypothetical protein